MKFTTRLLIALGLAVATNLVCNAISYFHTGYLSFSLYGWFFLVVAMAGAFGDTASPSEEEETRKARKKIAEPTYAVRDDRDDF